ncbi:hypothetical protein CN345_05105 [Bacillus thuringiensis]|nr:zinc ribbon domain-containing protein [Bacillus thuringiensis]PEZ42203.1 hypothetical protein CN345_05105 [Bacillus thuringiensis]PGY63167.1 hypothetical protein COE09_02510 [Bacillus thuringiensis]
MIIAPKNYANSPFCSSCNYKHKDVKNRNLREWTCPECNRHHDRDINVSINL